MQPVASPPPDLDLEHGFVVASGIECSAPIIAGRRRQDELRLTGHWTRYAEDLALVASYGIRYLRYGIPYHVVARDPSRFDWRWTDSALAALRDAGLEPIADLMHFGLPRDLTGFSDPRLPERYRRYVEAFAERYPWIRWYTPVNEPLVTATLSAKLGWWNERATDDRTFVKAIDNVAACAAIGMEVIRSTQPRGRFLQSDGCESFEPASPAAIGVAAFLNERRFIGWELAYGRRPGERVLEWLGRNGLGEERLAWFAEHGSSEGAIVGHDYYPGNEWVVESDGSLRRSQEPRGYAAVAAEHHRHMNMPFMLAETNWIGPDAPKWLAGTWNDALQLRLEGLPIRGYIWYGFVDHVDWDNALRVARRRANACGLVDHDRRPHPVGLMYRELATLALAGEFQPISLADVDTSREHLAASVPSLFPAAASAEPGIAPA